MPNGVEYKIDVDERGAGRIITRFEQLPVVLGKNLLRVIGNLGRIAYAQVVSVEPNRTGTLHSLTRLFVDQKDGWIRARVRVLADKGSKHNVAAAALEYGAHRMAKVQAYQMSGASRMVAAYQRRTNITAVHFLANSRIGIQAQALSEIKQAIGESLQGQA